MSIPFSPDHSCLEHGCGNVCKMATYTAPNFDVLADGTTVWHGEVRPCGHRVEPCDCAVDLMRCDECGQTVSACTCDDIEHDDGRIPFLVLTTCQSVEGPRHQVEVLDLTPSMAVALAAAFEEDATVIDYSVGAIDPDQPREDGRDLYDWEQNACPTCGAQLVWPEPMPSMMGYGFDDPQGVCRSCRDLVQAVNRAVRGVDLFHPEDGSPFAGLPR